MPRYAILGLNIELPWSLDRPETIAPADVRITLGAPAHIPYDPESDPLTMARHEDALELTIGGSCRILIPAVGGDVLCTPDPDEYPSEVRRHVLDHLIPRLLSRRNAVVLHASGAVLPAGAVGFLARSGRGKSTLALEMARHGAEMLSDDSLVIDPSPAGPIARPLWSNVRINPNDLPEPVLARVAAPVRNKVALHAGDDPALRFSQRDTPLLAIYLLEEAEQIEISQLAPRAALLSLMREAYHLEFDDIEGVERLMSRVEELGLTRRVYRLAYPRDFDVIGDVCDRVIAHVATL